MDKIYPMKKLHFLYISMFLSTSWMVGYGQNYRQPAVPLDSIATVRLANGFSVGFQAHPKGSSFLLQFSLSSYGATLTTQEAIFLSSVLDKTFRKSEKPIRQILEGLRIQTLANHSGITLVGDPALQDTALVLLADAITHTAYDSLKVASKAEQYPPQGPAYFEQSMAVLSHFAQKAIGNIAPSDSITLDSTHFAAFTHARLQPNCARLVYIGKGSADSTFFQKIDRAFGQWKVDTNALKSITAKDSVVNQPAHWFIDFPGAENPVVQLLLPLPLKDTLHKEAIFYILNKYLGGNPKGGLNKAFRMEQGVSYGFQSQYIKGDPWSWLVIQCSLANPNVEEAITQIKGYLENLKTTPIPALDWAQAIEMTRLYYLRNTERLDFVADLVDYSLSKPLPSKYFHDFDQQLLKISAKNLFPYFNRYLNTANAHVIVVGNLFAEPLAPHLSTLSKSYKIMDVEGRHLDFSQLTHPDSMVVNQLLEGYLDTISHSTHLDSVRTLSSVWESDIQGSTMKLAFQIDKSIHGYAMKLSMGETNLTEIRMLADTAFMLENNQLVAVQSHALMNQLRLQTQIFPELQIRESNWTLEGTTPRFIEGMPAQCIEGKLDEKRFISCYADQSGLKLYLENQINLGGTNRTIKQYYTNYQSVKGILFPHEIKMIGLTPEPLIFNLASLKINEPISAATFKPENGS